MAYEGFSWGGFVAPMVLAVEQRFAAAIVGVAGLDPWTRPRPEVDASNYAPSVRLPVLMLNGRYDLVTPLESSARPMFELLGTSPDNKVLRVYDSDHVLPQNEAPSSGAPPRRRPRIDPGALVRSRRAAVFVRPYAR